MSEPVIVRNPDYEIIEFLIMLALEDDTKRTAKEICACIKRITSGTHEVSINSISHFLGRFYLADEESIEDDFIVRLKADRAGSRMPLYVYTLSKRGKCFLKEEKKKWRALSSVILSVTTKK